MHSYRYRYTIIFAFAFTFLFAFWPLSVSAELLFQGTDATLHIDNESDETICAVYISPVTVSSLGQNYLADKGVIAPGEEKVFDLISDSYNLLLADCENNILLIVYNVDISTATQQVLTNMDVKTAGCHILNEEGVWQFQQGRLFDSLQTLHAAVACYHVAGDQMGEGTTLSNIAGVYHAQGRYNAALDHLEKALTLLHDVDDYVHDASILLNMGIINHEQGHYDDALARVEEALAISQKSGNRILESNAFQIIAAVYYSQGRYSEALEKLEEALAISRELGDVLSEGIALQSIGAAYGAQGYYATALDYLDEALTIHRELNTRLHEGTDLQNVAVIHHAQGAYNTALSYLEQALILFRESNDRAHEGIVLNGISVIYRDTGRYGKALERGEEALIILSEVGDQAGKAYTLNNIGKIYARQGRYKEALDSYKEALTIFHEIGAGVGEGTTLQNIAGIYFDQGHYDEALTLYEEALAIYRKVGNQASESVTLNNIGRVYDAQGHYIEALSTYGEALSISHEAGNQVGEGITLNNVGKIYASHRHYNEALKRFREALVILREAGDKVGEAITLNNITELYHAQGNYREALEQYEQAMVIFETVRAEAGSDRGRAGFIDQHMTLYDRFISVLQRLGDKQQAFVVTEHGRARAFVDTLTTGQVQLEDNAAAALLAQERALYAERRALQDALARSHAHTPPAPDEVQAIKADLGEVEADYTKIQEAISARSDQLATLIPSRSTVLELSEAQALLDENTTLLSYWMLGEEGTLAFVVTADSFDVVELPDVTPEVVQDELEGLYGWMNREHPHPRSLRQLHTWLIAPLAEYLHTSHVAIVPHQQLHYVPFAGLTDGTEYFGDQFTLSVLPSATTLKYLQENARIAQEASRENALIFGNPTTDLSPLVYAADEAQAIGSIFETNVYTGAAASETQLWDNVENVGLLHLAAHGEYNETNALYSAIALAPDGDHDGRLETWEIFGLPLKGTDLVTLSACETNVGDLSRGDELVGLTRAFFFAGTPTVISSLWQVDDEATEALIVAFYRHWKQDGMSKAEALQAAQTEVRSNPRWISPFYWAGFVLNGHPGQSR